MNVVTIFVSAAVLAALILITLKQVADSQPWLMRLLARSMVTDLVLHAFIIMSFGSNGHLLVAAEMAAITTTLFFWRYRRTHGFKLHVVHIKDGDRTLELSGGGEEIQQELSRRMLANPSLSVIKAYTRWVWAVHTGARA